MDEFSAEHKTPMLSLGVHVVDGPTGGGRAVPFVDRAGAVSAAQELHTY